MGLERPSGIEAVPREAKMIFPLMPQTQMDGGAEFTCKALSQKLPVSKCLTWFVDHTALQRKNSPCYNCTQGQCNREQFARS